MQSRGNTKRAILGNLAMTSENADSMKITGYYKYKKTLRDAKMSGFETIKIAIENFCAEDPDNSYASPLIQFVRAVEDQSGKGIVEKALASGEKMIDVALPTGRIEIRRGTIEEFRADYTRAARRHFGMRSIGSLGKTISAELPRLETIPLLFPKVFEE